MDNSSCCFHSDYLIAFCFATVHYLLVDITLCVLMGSTLSDYQHTLHVKLSTGVSMLVRWLKCRSFIKLSWNILGTCLCLCWRSFDYDVIFKDVLYCFLQRKSNTINKMTTIQRRIPNKVRNHWYENKKNYLHNIDIIVQMSSTH